MSISPALQEESCTPVCGCVCGCVCVWVCLCVGVNIKYVFTVSGLHPGFWIREGANWGNEKCRWGEVIRIICLLMNLTDPRGGGRNCAQGGAKPPSMQPCTVCSRY